MFAQKKHRDPICGMEVSTASPWQLVKDGEKFYFCNKRCLEKFAAEEHVAITPDDLCCVPPKAQWYRNKVLMISVVLGAAAGLSYVVPALVPFRQSLFMYFGAIWWAILLGLVIGGVVDYYIPREFFTHTLARSQKRTVFYAVGLGFLMSVCSHGILALAMQFHKKGASTPAVVAFLLASPWANLPLTLILVGFFGLVKALYIILVAILIAIVSGLIFQKLESRGMVEKNQNTIPLDVNYSARADFQKRFHSYRLSREQVKKDIKGIFDGAMSLSNMVLWWILVGVGLASLTGAYIPQHIFHDYMGPHVPGLFVTLLVATILEVCSEGTAPLAFEIFRQTGALGNSFVFLMAGVVTDYTEIGLLWHNVGRKTAVWLPLITVPQVILFGFLANIIF